MENLFEILEWFQFLGLLHKSTVPNFYKYKAQVVEKGQEYFFKHLHIAQKSLEKNWLNKTFPIKFQIFFSSPSIAKFIDPIKNSQRVLSEFVLGSVKRLSE